MGGAPEAMAPIWVETIKGNLRKLRFGSQARGELFFLGYILLLKGSPGIPQVNGYGTT